MTHIWNVGSEITGGEGDVFEVVAKVAGPCEQDGNKFLVPFDMGMPPVDRILFIGSPSEIIGGLAEKARCIRINFTGGLPAVELPFKVHTADDDWICIIKKATTASYSPHLRRAAEIADEREPQYGSVLDNLADTAMIAKAMFNLDITPVQLAQVMIAFKTSREKHSHKQDNIIDNINYHAILLAAIEDAERTGDPHSPSPHHGESSDRQE